MTIPWIYETLHKKEQQNIQGSKLDTTQQNIHPYVNG